MIKEKYSEDIEKAYSRIAPAWTLENSVAVNPYLGLSEKRFEEAAALLDHRGDIQLYMPLEFYLDQYKKGMIASEDLEYSLRKHDSELKENLCEWQ